MGIIKINNTSKKPSVFLNNDNPLFNDKLRLLEQFFNLSQDMICIIGLDGYFKKVSPDFASMLGYTVEELMSKPYSYYIHEKDGSNTAYEDNFPYYFENSYMGKDGSPVWFSWQSSKPTNDNLIYLIARDISKQKKAEREAKQYAQELEVYKYENLESLRYAQRLQNTIMPSPASFRYFFPESFITYMPKQAVSGDFFYFDKMNEKILVTMGDCTGHGVPGGLLSVVAVNMLHNAMHHENLTTPNQLIRKIDFAIQKMLTHKFTGERMDDGMDMSLCSIDPKTLMMEYVAINNPIYIVRDKALIEIKPEKYTLGSNKGGTELNSKEFQLYKNDMVYLFSDGYTDQFGGPRSKKFGLPQFRKLLIENSTRNSVEQKTEIEKIIQSWMGIIEQTDDISMLGFRI